MRNLLTALSVSLALVASACGSGSYGSGGSSGSSGSSSAGAKSTACAAVGDIQSQVASLKGVTTGTTTLAGAKTAAGEIQKDLNTIQDQLPNLKAPLKQELKTANAAFAGEVQNLLDAVKSSGSTAGAAAALQSAGGTLAASYSKTLGNVGC
jgi:hypothetical protein